MMDQEIKVTTGPVMINESKRFQPVYRLEAPRFVRVDNLVWSITKKIT